ncbi:hypothetical protein DICPUDRAFT_81244 [Dictyostelium purpureum]|uniref:RRM domain-containing protein n=1 Tax=Dictyostelium purpureum TaxID=5786 RepID=F0ZSX0_DICPU|nr:uncharacterized protein DICPUDRAFT_81244 [Dictyostelium purpureum]EGC32944.1 hypothetical protein DICPUDRAFT_81244 [Dictyostelium purpureum]|eukprot:XP_003290510.1 hypothetical protein DICPUDRAFT_81244 [Dictyostelium purpureum]
MTQHNFNIPNFSQDFNPIKPHNFNNLIQLNDMEIFLFKTPSNKKTILITELERSIKEKDLRDIFSRFGLIYDIKIYMDQNKPTSMCLLKFFLENSATMAHNASVRNEIEINGKHCNVMISKFKSDKELDMPITKSIQAINGILGFNQWSTEINQMERDYTRELIVENQETNEIKKVFESRWASQVYFTLKQIDLKVQAVGFGTEEGDTVDDAVKQAKKVSITNARKEIFSKIGIIINNSDNTSTPFVLDESIIVLPPQEEDHNQYFDDSFINDELNQQQQEEEEQPLQLQQEDEFILNDNEITMDFDFDATIPQ